MKYTALLLTLFIAAASASAGPFVRITGVDTRTDYPRVSVSVTVNNPDKGDVIRLDEENLLIYEEGYRAGHVKVTSLSETEDYLYLVFSIDSSKSVSTKFLKGIKSSAAEIASSAGNQDKIAVYRFNGESVLLNNFTSKRDELLKSIRAIERLGNRTLLFDAVYDSLELAGRVKGSRKAVIVFTDGRDEGSGATDNDIIEYSRKIGVPVFFISVNPGNMQKIARVAKLTGGRLAYSANPKDVSGMYRAVMSAVKSRYVIKYITMFKPDGKQRQLEVRLKYGDIKDRDIYDFTIDGPGRFEINLNSNVFLIIGIMVLVLLMVVLVVVIMSRSRRKILDRLEDEPLSMTRNFDDMTPIDDIVDAEENPQQDEDQLSGSQAYAGAWLLLKGGTRGGLKFNLDSAETIIGSGEGVDFAVDETGVSLKHAKIKKVNSSFYLFDLVSEGGTFLNGSKLLRPKVLYDWDEIRLGTAKIIFRGRG